MLFVATQYLQSHFRTYTKALRTSVYLIFFRDTSRAPRLWGAPYTKATFGQASSSFGKISCGFSTTI